MPATHALAGLTSKIAGLGIAAKVGLGASLAAAGVVGASAAGALPAPADHAVRHAIAAVTPLETDAPAESEADHFGRQVSADATGESDGDKGVDGPSVAAGSPGAEHRSDNATPGQAPGLPPGATGDTGLTRANQTPAAAHAPDSPPSTEPTPGTPTDAGRDHPASADPSASVPSTVPARGDGGEHRPGE